MIPRTPWTMMMQATTHEAPQRLVPRLTSAILSCGGWVLSRGSDDAGIINMLFEFERHACLDIYGILISTGLDLTPSGHLRITELCQCTRNSHRACGSEIASIQLEIHANPCKNEDARQ